MVQFVKILAGLLYVSGNIVIAENEVAPANPVITLDDQNYEEILKGSKNIFVAFTAPWCPYSRQLTPIWNSAAILNLKRDPSVRFATIDCQAHPKFCKESRINKYPSMVLYQWGVRAGEFRGPRMALAFMSWLETETVDPVQIVNDQKALDELGLLNDPTIIFAKIPQSFGEYQIFYDAYSKMALSTKAVCKFHLYNGADVGENDMKIISKVLGEESSMQVTSETRIDAIEEWVMKACDPLVSKLTYSNSEALVEKSKPFVLLFSKFTDEESKTWFKNVVQEKVSHERERVTFLVADAENYQHPIKHLGRSIQSCPIVAIDSFKHMYIFEDDIKDLENDGVFQKFIDDLFNSQHHEHFHRGNPNAHHCYWRQTGACSSKGPRESHYDSACDKRIDSRTSGFCECGHSIVMEINCENDRPSFTCEEVCKKELESRPVNLENCMFRQSKGCEAQPDEMLPEYDADCMTVLFGDRAGKCECGFGATKDLECGHQPTSCSSICEPLIKEAQVKKLLKSVDEVKPILAAKKLAQKEETKDDDGIAEKVKDAENKRTNGKQNGHHQKMGGDNMDRKKNNVYDSSFKDLGPSKKRYSFLNNLKEEL